jgi:hypothetical protein
VQTPTSEAKLTKAVCAHWRSTSVDRNCRAAPSPNCLVQGSRTSQEHRQRIVRRRRRASLSQRITASAPPRAGVCNALLPRTMASITRPRHFLSPSRSSACRGTWRGCMPWSPPFALSPVPRQRGIRRLRVGQAGRFNPRGPPSSKAPPEQPSPFLRIWRFPTEAGLWLHPACNHRQHALVGARLVRRGGVPSRRGRHRCSTLALVSRH